MSFKALSKLTAPMKHYYTLPKQAGLLLFLLTAVLSSFSTKLYAQMPPNLDFGYGNFTNWTCWVGYASPGTAATGPVFSGGSITAPIGGNPPGPTIVGKSRHAITTGSDSDLYGGFPIVSPLGGLFSLRLGTDSIGGRAERVQYRIHVPSTAPSYNVQVQFAIVFEDPSHTPAEQPAFQVVAYDSATGAVVPAGNNLYISGTVIPGFIKRTGISVPIWYLPWTTSTINLSGMGGKTIILECTAMACAPRGHMGYGYFDVIGVADTLAPSLLRYSAQGDSVVLQGPPGYAAYQWFNQDFSIAFNAAADSARTKTLPVPSQPEYYNLIITPYASIGVPDTIRSAVLKAPVGVSPSAQAVANIYPNPANTALHIRFPSQFTGQLSLVNSLGQTVYGKKLSGIAAHDIATAALPAGTYTLLLENARGEKDGTFTISVVH